MRHDRLAIFGKTPDHAELGFTTGKAALRARPLDQRALHRVVKKVAQLMARCEQRRLLDLFGALDWDLEFDDKAERTRDAAPLPDQG